MNQFLKEVRLKKAAHSQSRAAQQTLRREQIAWLAPPPDQRSARPLLMVRQKSFLTIFCFRVLFVHALRAATITLMPSADTSLMESFTNNNLGGAPYLLAGSGENLLRHRALLQFDLLSQIPAQSKIKTVTLILEVTHQPANGFTAADFSLHRVLRPWGEGNKLSPTNCNSCVGQGMPATTNEATWNDRFALTTNAWDVPGAATNIDYATAVSASQAIYDIGNSPYSFNSTAQLVADVQTWLDIPQNNFGWILMADAESIAFTARRFGSREDANFPPRLEIEYVMPPMIYGVKLFTNQFQFSFGAEAGQSYSVEFRNSFSPTNFWMTLTNISAPLQNTNVTIFDSRSATQRFYRVVAP
ncbi:MAG: DNRLRE domain-containing protein [Verrucomicrobiota bacterium]|nr:DNRLRE domain-containing protein [Verrucomicrobiota bacterium]